jgi:hypothetical protein
MAGFSEFGDSGMMQGMIIQDSLSDIQDGIEATEKQLNNKKAALATKKAEAARVTEKKDDEEQGDLSSVINDARRATKKAEAGRATERKEDEEQDNLSSVSNDAPVGGPASTYVFFCLPPRRGLEF